MKNFNLNSMTIAELRNLNSLVIATIKAKKAVESAKTKSTLSVGTKVTVNHPKLDGMELVITKINRTRAVMGIPGTIRSWNVPFSMIEVVS